MVDPLVQILRDNHDTFVDRLVLRLNDAIPAYQRLSGSDQRASVYLLTDALFEALETGKSDPLTRQLFTIIRERVGQGFSVAEFLRALYLVLPVSRELIRQVGPRDPALAPAFAALEDRMLSFAALAASLYSETSARNLETKNQELNRLNQLLQARERALSQEARDAGRALNSANQFNQRVLESLSSGVLVIAPSRTITLYTQRMEAILELPAEAVLGRDSAEALAPLRGVDHAMVVEAVRATGRFPLTKMVLTTAKGQARHVFIRASRLYADDGSVEGTVFVVDDVSEREQLIDAFSRYVSRDLLTRLLARAGPLRLEGEKRVCTVLFADVRGFTGIAERLQPEEVHLLLNDFLHVMVESIVEHGGFIDKFVGDKVMALFTGGDHTASAIAAVTAARSIHAAIAQLNAARKEAGQLTIEVGVGVNTGAVVVGNVGARQRMDFTAVGDVVNVTDRLQGLAAGGELLVGPDTARLLAGAFTVTDLGERPVKGRAAPVRVFRVERGVGA